MDKTLYVEVLRSEWDAAQSVIEGQVRQVKLQEEIRADLAALRAQQPGVVLPSSNLAQRIDQAITDFTRGSASMHVPPLDTDVDVVLEECRKLVKRLNSFPVSAGGVDERAALAAEDQQFCAWAVSAYQINLNTEELNLKNRDIVENRKGWMARAALTASAQSVPCRSEQVPSSDIAFLAEYILAREYGRPLPNYLAVGRFPIDVAEKYAASPGKGGDSV